MLIKIFLFTVFFIIVKITKIIRNIWYFNLIYPNLDVACYKRTVCHDGKKVYQQNICYDFIAFFKYFV